jgi:hypothetical protein
MASNRQDQILRFIVQAEGEDALVPFLKSVKDLEGASDETREAADALLAKLGEASRLQAIADLYERTGASVAKLGANVEAAKAKAAALGIELQKTENPSKRQQEAFDNAAAAAARLDKQFQNQMDIPLMRGQCSGAWEATIPAHVMPAFRAMGSQ